MIFPPAFFDSSSYWNTGHSQLQLQQTSRNTHTITSPSPAGPGDGGGNNSTPPHPQEGLMAMAAGGGGGDGGGGARNGDGGGGSGRNSKPMTIPEQARLARLPQPEPALNCPRCDSTNTKFCYYNNYSLTQPRHFCRACHRYWTRGGALRDVPASRRYRRHAKRSSKPAAGAATAGMSSVTLTTPSTTACATLTATDPSGLQYSMFGSTPPSSQYADSFDPASLARLLFADGGVHHHHHQGNGNGMEQWAAVQMQSLPLLHAMDHQISGPPAAAMPTTMAELQDMFHLGLQSGGSGHNGEDDGGNHQFHQDVTPPAKRDHQQQQQQQQEDYPSSRGMYADIVNGSGCGYNYYSSTTNASGN